jgi:S1-C subfamily serine protease
MKRFWGAVGVLAVLSQGSATLASPIEQLIAQVNDPAERQTILAYHRAQPSVVTLRAGNGAGTGVIVSPNGWVLTNMHVIRTPNNINITLADGRTVKGELMAAGRPPAEDVALVQIRGASGFSVMSLGDSNAVLVGQQVLAIGAPFGLEHTLTKGIISRIDAKKNRLQTDAAINPGNSGGPLLNAQGQMIGMNQTILNPEGRSSAGIGFAIPVNVLKSFLQAYQVKDPTLVQATVQVPGPVRAGYAGYQPISVQTASVWHQTLDSFRWGVGQMLTRFFSAFNTSRQA